MTEPVIVAEPMELHEYHDYAAEQERQVVRRSTLGSGCCSMCGLPRAACKCAIEGWSYSVEEWDAIQREVV